MLPYAKVMSPLLDIPAGEIDDDDIRSLLERHKPKLEDMKLDIRPQRAEFKGCHQMNRKLVML